MQIYYPSDEIVKNAAVSGMDAYKALCAEAEADYEGYWAKRARELITWKSLSPRRSISPMPFFKWFADGKLNASYNCLDRNVENGLGDKVAIIFEADSGEVAKVTYKGNAGQGLQDGQPAQVQGRQKGDRVHLLADDHRRYRCHAGLRPHRRDPFHRLRWFSPPSPCATGSMTPAPSCSSPPTVSSAAARPFPKPIADEAFAMGGCESVKDVIVFKRTGGDCAMTAGRDSWFHEGLANQADTCEPEWVDAEHIRSSSSTLPVPPASRRASHCTGGYLLHAMLTMKWTFDIKQSDTFWCLTDIGWVTGHTYITYGPWPVA